MKFQDILDLTVDELHAKIENLGKELFEARFKQATNQLEDTAIYRRKRHEIAQMHTALNQKQSATSGRSK